MKRNRNRLNAPLRAAQKAWIGAAVLALLSSLAALIVGTTILVRQADTTLTEIEQQAELSARLRDMQAVLFNVVDAETKNGRTTPGVLASGCEIGCEFAESFAVSAGCHEFWQRGHLAEILGDVGNPDR